MPLAEARAAPARFDPSTQRRRGLIAKINVARQQLQIDEDDYRQALFEATGQTSLKACSEAQMERMLGWMKGKGFRPLPGKSAAQHPAARKARALWISLYHLGAVHNPSEKALEAFAARQLGCERMVWARQSDAFRLIEALKAMATRAGWQLTDPQTGAPLSPAGLQISLCSKIVDRMKRVGLAAPAWSIEDAALHLCGIRDRVPATDPYAAEHFTRLANALGRALRDHGGADHG